MHAMRDNSLSEYGEGAVRADYFAVFSNVRSITLPRVIQARGHRHIQMRERVAKQAADPVERAGFIAYPLSFDGIFQTLRITVRADRQGRAGKVE